MAEKLLPRPGVIARIVGLAAIVAGILMTIQQFVCQQGWEIELGRRSSAALP